MPVDGSGNFTRSYSWAGDKAGGIKIIASRMDGEFDNYAAALNQAFWRTGIVGMTGALNMGGNAINSVADGSAGTPGIRFASDGNSGIFQPGVGKVALAAGGVNRIEANASGVSVNGTFTANGISTLPAVVSSNLTVSGPTSLFNASVSGSLGVTGATTLAGLSASNGTFSGALGVSGVTTLSGNLLLSNTGFSFSSDGSNDTGWRWVSDGVMAARSNSVDRLAVDTTGVAVTGALSVSSNATISGTLGVSAVFTASSFSNLRGRTFFGATGHGNIDSDATSLFLRGDNITFQNGSGSTTPVIINSSGNTGIGTLSPLTRLDVVGAAITPSNKLTYAAGFGNAGGGNGDLTIGSDATYAYLQSWNARTLYLNSQGNNIVTGAGNVGIGTTTVPQRLTVNGGVYATTYYTDAGSGIWMSGQGAFATGIASVGTALNLYAGSAARLSINSFGGITSSDLSDAVGYKGVPQNAQGGAYTLAMSDMGKHVLMSNGGVVALTIPPNSSVAFQVGTAVTIVNDTAAAKTITQGAGVTLVFGGVGTTGNRTLGTGGICTLLKIGTDKWYISGAGVS